MLIDSNRVLRVKNIVLQQFYLNLVCSHQSCPLCSWHGILVVLIHICYGIILIIQLFFSTTIELVVCLL